MRRDAQNSSEKSTTIWLAAGVFFRPKKIFISIRLVMIIQWFRLCGGPSGSPNIEGWLGEQRVVLSRCEMLWTSALCLGSKKWGGGHVWNVLVKRWWKDDEMDGTWGRLIDWTQMHENPEQNFYNVLSWILMDLLDFSWILRNASEHFGTGWRETLVEHDLFVIVPHFSCSIGQTQMFFMPRCAEMPTDFIGSKDWTLSLWPGTVLIFPSWLSHWVRIPAGPNFASGNAVYGTPIHS